MKISYGQDGTVVDALFKTKFSLKQGFDTRFDKKNQTELFDFVGFVITPSDILAVLPKKFYSVDLIKKLNSSSAISEDVSLLFDVIHNYISRENTSASAIKHIGNSPEFHSDYPFSSFFAIYKYYSQFGIYKEIENKTNTKKGIISWRDTIRKSIKIVDGNNIIHLPIYYKTNKFSEVFVSDCMIFAINHTLERFPFFLKMQKTNYKTPNFDFLENSDYVINYLQRIKGKIFKDINKNLINSLIDFFEQIALNLKGGNIHVKINYFDRIWEKLVETHLNNRFIAVDENTKEIIFGSSTVNKVVFQKKTFAIDMSNNLFHISPDYYLLSNDVQYIFDAKYYLSINSLNYKQISYNQLLAGLSPKVCSILILPCNGVSYSRTHFLLSTEFRIKDDEGHEIIEQYLNIRQLMHHYISRSNENADKIE